MAKAKQMAAVAAPELAERFKALGHPHRLAIFARLAACCRDEAACAPDFDGGLPCVGDLAADLELPTSTLSNHLKELERAGLIERHRHGTTIRCGVTSRTLADMAAFFTAHLPASACCPPAVPAKKSSARQRKARP